MKRPGDTLRSLAARVCSASTMERLIDPVIADMQCEHAEAVRQRRVWRCCWIRMTGCWAFWKGAGMHSIEALKGGVQEWLGRDDRAMGRVLGFVAAATVVVTLLLQLFVLLQPGSPFHGERSPDAFTLLYLVPSALPLAIPMGVLFGVLYAMRHRTVTKRIHTATMILAICCTVGSFGLLAWTVPASNQAFREAFSGIPPQALLKGTNELTLQELRQELDKLSNGAMRGSVQERDVTFTYYMRFALSVVPIVLGLFALGLLNVGRLQRSPFALGVAAVMTCVCYYVLLFTSRAAVLQGWNAGMVWMPNIVFLAATLFLVHRTRQSLETV